MEIMLRRSESPDPFDQSYSDSSTTSWTPLTDTKSRVAKSRYAYIGIRNPIYYKTQREETLYCVLCLLPYGTCGTEHAANCSTYVFCLEKHT